MKLQVGEITKKLKIFGVIFGRLLEANDGLTIILLGFVYKSVDMPGEFRTEIFINRLNYFYHINEVLILLVRSLPSASRYSTRRWP